jgi:oligopeptide/dipeptide ABC transporter ATP-binding protein
MMENKEILLQLQDVNTYFRVPQGTLKAVNGVSLTIHKGETVGLVGESGCGKSTLGKTIMRLYKPDSGKVMFQGRDIWSYKGKEKKNYAKNVQMIFQDPYACLDPLSVVHDIVAEGLKIHKMYSGAELDARVEELLEMVGLGKEHGSRFPHEFSGGQRQRIGIARALSLEPSLIVCDEPISALDVSIQAQVVNLLKRLQKEMGLSYLFITHDLSMVRQISHRIAVMYLGSLVEIADSEDIYLKNYHPYTQALLSAIPIANPEVERKRKRILLEGDVPSPVNLPEGCSFCNRCPKATDKCKKVKPVLREVEKGHMVACHLA